MMRIRQAGYIALAKRLAGWIIFIPSLISTLISMLKYIENFALHYQGQQSDIGEMMTDFAKVIIDMARVNSHWLNFFWQSSPLPDFQQKMNIAFWIIYLLIFIGMALRASGIRMSCRLRNLRDHLQDQLIIDQAKNEQGISREQLEANICVPNCSIFRQIGTLYLSPVIIVVLGYFVLSLFKLL